MTLFVAAGGAAAEEGTEAEERAEASAPEQGEAEAEAGVAASDEALGEDELDAAAAEQTGPPPGVEVMRVRGRGIAAIETEVPSSVTQFDAATIEALGAQDVSDLSRVTPNVNIVQPGATQATFFIRGVGLSDFSSNAAGAVTVFQDDVSINAPAIQTGQLYDIETVEVVRGPQGTGPYRNASAGAIRVRSRRPTGNYTAQLRSSVGRYDTKGDKGAKNAWIQDYEGALEVPIIEDALSSRFAFRFRDAEPYKTNGCARALPFPEPGTFPDPTRFDVRLPQPRTRGPIQNRDPWSPDDPRVSQCGEHRFTVRPQQGPPGPENFSPVPVGLPEAVNDEHNWAARGTFRLTPPDTDTEIFLNAHGSRLDQDATLGQVIGTNSLPGGNASVRFAGETSDRGATFGGYADADVREEFEILCGGRNPMGGCLNPAPTDELARRLADTRPLDIRPYRGDYNRVGQETRDAWGGFLSGETRLELPLLGDTRILALSSYDQYERSADQDTDFTPEILFEVENEDEAWQMYHELRMSGELDTEPFAWEIGGYYLGEDLDFDGTTFLISSGQQLRNQRTYNQTIESFGVWTHFAWDFADDFTLEGGVRWNWERKEFKFRSQEFGLLPFDETNTQDETWQTPTGQIVLTYHLDEERSVYARYSRGFKAGHFNALATRNLDAPPADEEYNDSWEAGIRGQWLDRRVSLGSAFFYYRYENYQVFLFQDGADSASPPVLAILNAKKAENFGIEVEGTLTPLRGWVPRLVEGLRLSANFGWLHGEYLDFVTTTRFLIGPQLIDVPIDFSGQRLQNAPEYKVSGTAEWTLDLGRWGYLVPRYDINWSDDVFFDPNEGRGTPDPTGGAGLVEFGTGQSAFYLHNVRLAYRTPSGNVEVAGWIRNLEDQVYKNFAFDASRFTGAVINFTGEPRTIGVDVTFTF